MDAMEDLMSAVEARDVDAVRVALTRPGVDVNSRGNDGRRELPLHVAAAKGLADVVEALLEVSGIQANAGDRVMWQTPLEMAILGGHTEVVKTMLHFVPEVVDVNKHCPLVRAIECQHMEIAKLLLGAPGIDVNRCEVEVHENSDLRASPLYAAIWWGSVDFVELLINTPGIDVNKESATPDGGLTRSPLYAALIDNCREEVIPEIVELLLGAPGIDVNVGNNNDTTPLMNACYRGHLGVLNLLLEAPGIDVYKEDCEGLTVLSHMVALEGVHEFHTEVIARLLEVPGFDVNKGNEEYGDTPLMYASRDGLPEAVRQLLAAPGIDVNRANTDGQTPLALAVEKGKCEVVQLLLQAPGIDVNREDKYGWTPLLVASDVGRADVVKLLLDVPGIRVFRTVKGRTAMDIAVKYLSGELVRKPPLFTFERDRCAHVVHNDAEVVTLLEEVVDVKRAYAALLLTLRHLGVPSTPAAELAFHGLPSERAKAMARRMRKTWPMP